MSNVTEISLIPIGKIEGKDKIYKIIINKEYIKGLKYLSLFSHAIIIYSNNILQSTIKIDGIDEKRGIVSFEGDFNSISEVPIYDIKPYFPCEDRVRKALVPQGEQIKKYNLYQATDGRINFIGKIKKVAGEFYIDIKNECQYIKDLEGYSHIKILWWFNGFDKPKYRRITECNPPYENAPRTGVFASRSPVRPNPIALTTAKILNINKESGLIKVSKLDCYNDTPLIKIIPYIPTKDKISEVKVPKWLEHWPSYLDDDEINFKDNEIILKKSNFDIIKKYSKKPINLSFSNYFKQERLNKYEYDKGIVIRGARQNNLKNIDITIPYNKITVITGVSGSGKSSLAFETLFAESQRRFLDNMGLANWSINEQIEKPDVDSISGLPPSISISQSNISRNPRSTVGTITGIYEYIKAIFSSIGVRHCPNCGDAIIQLTLDEIKNTLLKLFSGTKIKITPYKKRTPEFNYIISEKRTNNILISYLEKALDIGKGAINVIINDEDRILFQTTQMCYHCNHVLFELTSSTFSYNNVESRCPVCNGLGIQMKIDESLIVSNPNFSILDGASRFWGDLRKFKENPNANWAKGEVLALADYMKVDLEKPWNKLPKEFRKIVIWGSKGQEVTFTYSNSNGRSGNITRAVEGAYNYINRIFNESKGDSASKIADEFMNKIKCNCCNGERLSREGRIVEVLGMRFPTVSKMTINRLKEWVIELPQSLLSHELDIVGPILKQLIKKLELYINIGLDYLTLDRAVPTLSGGELQRLRLIKQLGSGITNMLYILDEPSTGLHYKDYERLIRVIRELRDTGNTIVIVEHNAEIMKIADYIIDIGPGAGFNGGRIVAEGTLVDIIKNSNSETGKYLSEEKKVKVDRLNLENNSNWIKLRGAKINNLKNIDISFPIGSMTCITGVSGAGKSSLISKVLYPALQDKINGNNDINRYCDYMSGDKYFNGIINVNQNPIGRTPRSTPATYIGLMDEIRKVFASTKKAKERGYKINKFSFNSKEGQCEKCHGEGEVCTKIFFMADIWTKCPVCMGNRYKNDVLEVKYKDKSIYDVLEMNVEQALDLFMDEVKIRKYLNILVDVGLGYMKLGQSANTLSGGEAQRIKLARELCTNKSAGIMYILDEPTTGLHFIDVQNLLVLLQKLRSDGNTIVIIEHNLDVIRNADWIIELGPRGGEEGGYVTAQGTPEKVL